MTDKPKTDTLAEVLRSIPGYSEPTHPMRALCAQIDALKARVAELEKKPQCRECANEIDDDELVCYYCISRTTP